MYKVFVIIAWSARLVFAFGAALWSPELRAGGSGLNTVVVLNQTSSNSIELANYFCRERSVPPENVLRISWPGNNISWSGQDFTNVLLNPLSEMLFTRALTNQVEYVVLSMDIPFETVANSTNWNATTSAVFYGLKQNDTGNPANLNRYFGSEMAFAIQKSNSSPYLSFLTTMLTAGSLESARQMVAQGVRGSGNHPVQPVVLAKSSDPDRNFRSGLFDNAIFNARIRGEMTINRTNSDDSSGLTGLLGYQTGLAQYEVSSNTFVGGAIGDSATSFGGRIFGPNGQTSLLEFIHAGATGSYGTVAEPLADPDKFPDPLVYFYQARGFSLAESYYQSLRKPYLGLIVGKPLSAPFAVKGHAAWSLVKSNTALTGTEMLGLSFSAHDSAHPLQQVDLFVDGRFHSTLTNLATRIGNVLTVTLNGFPISYTVPTNATISRVATNLAAMINDPLATNATPVRATAVGDRIELQSPHPSIIPCPYYVVDCEGSAANGPVYRAVYLGQDFPPALIPVGLDNTGAYRLMLQIPTPLNYLLEASTNLHDWLPIFTNTTAGLVEFRDAETSKFSRRFYRIVGPVPNQPPRISVLSPTNDGFRIRIESQLGQPCALLASPNIVDWTALVTNATGGGLDFVDNENVGTPARFYRAWLVPPPQASVSVTHPSPTTALIRVDNAAQPFVLERSTNGLNWVGLATNFAFRDIQVNASSAVGAADLTTTFVQAARPTLHASAAFGVQSFTFLAATLTSEAWVQFVFTTTNGGTVTVGVTNTTPGISATNLAWQLVNQLNAETALQGGDGVVAKDYYVNAGGQAKFNLRARSPGEPAAQMGVLANVSGFATGVSVSPATYRKLTRNLGDLRSRNHLYVSAGLPALEMNFPLNTELLPDGFHELTAVGYEGSSVRAQTHRAVSVQVQNTGLTANLTTAVTNILSVATNFDITVTANTNAVAEILLFSTGGLLVDATNQSAATFTVNGHFLGVGEHPFYALVTTTNGLRYRTSTHIITLVAP